MKPIKIFIALMIVLTTIFSATAYEGVEAAVDIISPSANWLGTLPRWELSRFNPVMVEVTGVEMGYVNMECGIYTEDDIRSWYNGMLPGYGFVYSILGYDATIQNCIDNQPYVHSKSFYIQPGQVQSVEFLLTRDEFTDKEDDWVIHCSTFNHCYTDSPDDFINYHADTQKIILYSDLDIPPESDHCINGQTDGDESDFDCGGSCPDCALGLRCREDSDCATDICEDLRCVDKRSEPDPGTDDQPDEEVSTIGTMPAWMLPAIIIMVLIIIAAIVLLFVMK